MRYTNRLASLLFSSRSLLYFPCLGNNYYSASPAARGLGLGAARHKLTTYSRFGKSETVESSSRVSVHGVGMDLDSVTPWAG